MIARVFQVFMIVLVLAVFFAAAWDATRPDPNSCYKFTREVKILQACDGAKSCTFSPRDLQLIDRLQEECQELGK